MKERIVTTFPVKLLSDASVHEASSLPYLNPINSRIVHFEEFWLGYWNVGNKQEEASWVPERAIS